MNPNPSSRLLHELSDERVPQDLNLLPRIRAQIETTHRAARKSAIRAAALLVAVVLLSVLFTRPAVVSALKEMFGFIPGVGRIDQSAPLRVLAYPATSTSGDYTLDVESAVLDSNRTVIDYTLTGAFPTWDDPALKPEVCVLTPLLRLPDGSELRWLSQENSPSASGLQLQVIYPALPPSVDRAVLIFPCLPELPTGEGPQNWQLPLAFAPAPPDLTVYPVIDLPTSPPETAAGQGWMQLELNGAAVLEDGYYLQAALRWQEDPSIIEVEISPDALRLEDAAGQAVSVWFADQFPLPTPAEERSLALNLQTAPITAPGPAHLFVNYVIVRQPASARFTLDPGADPQPGHTWQLDQKLDVNGRNLTVRSAEYLQPAPGEPAMLMLHLEADREVFLVTALDPEHETLGGGGSPNTDYTPFRAAIRYPGGFPSEPITVEITTLALRRSGPWSVEWTPPATTPAPADPIPTPVPPALPLEQGCPEDALLQSSLAALPAELTGRVAYMEWTGFNHATAVSNLDGSEHVLLGDGIFPNLSLDGSRVVYTATGGGLLLRSLPDGPDVSLTANPDGAFDIWPAWSPDSSQIAFDRVVEHIADVYLIDSDGSNLRPAVSSAEDERLLGWSPDSRILYYRVTVSNGCLVRALDVNTGAILEMGRLPLGGQTTALSPDGALLLYFMEQGTYISALNGSNPLLVVAATPRFTNQIHPSWSPDGRWIVLSYWESADTENPGLAFIQPQTCQAVLLPDHKAGWISSWVP